MFKFGQRDIVKDAITGFEGAIIARTEFANGCRRYSLQPTKLDEKGNMLDPKSLDEQDLILVMQAPKAATTGPNAPTHVSPPGGPPARCADAKF